MYQVDIGGTVLAIDVGDAGVTVNDQLADVVYSNDRTDCGHILINGRSFAFFCEDSGDGTWLINIDGREHNVTVKSRKDILLENFGGADSADSGHHTIKAPMPGLVLRINVSVGDEVTAGHSLLVLEAMKMENEIASPGPGQVAAIHVTDGEAVGKSALLIEIEPSSDGA